MAMRPSTPTRSGGTPPVRPRQPAMVRPVYEDFRPMIEWQQDEESNSLLLIHLPGFQREHLKLSTEGRNILRARGERLITGNKWSRFQEDYPLPEDCNVRGIRAKFEGGILTITIPRKKESKEATIKATTTEDTTPKPSQKRQEDLSSQKQMPALLSPPEAALEKTHKKPADDNGKLRSAIPSVTALGKGRTEITQETPPDNKMVTEKPMKIPNEKPYESKEESDYQKRSAHEKVEKTIEESKAPKDKGDSAYKDLRHLQADKSQEESDYSKVPDQLQNITRKAPEQISEQGKNYPKSGEKIEKLPDKVDINIPREITKVKQELLQKDKGEIEAKERKTTTSVGSTDYGLASYMQAVKKFLDRKEERELLVNAGAAVLVIVAFGAYLYFLHNVDQ